MTLRAISIAPDGYPNPVEADRQLVDLMGNRIAGVIFENWNGNVPLDLQVNPGDGHTVVISEGQALIREKTNPRDRGGYFFSNDSEYVVDLPVPQSEPFFARIIARVADPQYGAVTGDVGPRFDVISGVPASAPVPPDDATINAIAGTPGGWISIASVRINPSDTGAIPGGQITDNRAPGGFGTITCVSWNRPKNLTKAGTRIYEVDLRQHWIWDRDRWVHLGGAPLYRHFVRTTDTVVSNNSEAVLNGGWSNTEGSPGNESGFMYASGGVSVPYTGIYALEALATWQNAASGTAITNLVKNDDANVRLLRARNPLHPSQIMSVGGSTKAKLNAGERVTMAVFQNSGGGLTLRSGGSASNPETHWNITFLGTPL